MTVKELLRKLQAELAADPTLADVIVQTQGCDCIGDADDIYLTSRGRFQQFEGEERALLIGRA